MSKLAIVYHSAHGHTEFIARQVHVGTLEVEGVDAHLVGTQDITSTPDELLDYDGFILGSPTYLGGVSGPLKSFMVQAGHSAPADSFVPGDVKTARMFGRHFARSLNRVIVPA